MPTPSWDEKIVEIFLILDKERFIVESRRGILTH